MEKLEDKSLRWFMIGLMTVVPILVFASFLYRSLKHNEFTEEYKINYWQNCDVEFCGVVSAMKEVEKGDGYVCLNKIFANKDAGYLCYIDDKVFVCSISDNKILYISSVSQLKIGDSICYNVSQNHSEQVYRNGKLYLDFKDRISYYSYYDNKLFPNGFKCE